MKLLVGLGNPGQKYQSTRHNAGFWLIERFAAQTATALRKDAKFQALIGRHEPSGTWLVMPQSFMNLSGKPVQLLAGFFKIEAADMLVVHDELDFAPGVVKIKQGGGIAGHNGLKDISGRLGTHDYWRLRIGIGHPGVRQAVIDYVLHKPSDDEQAEIDAAITRALDVLPLALAGDMQGAMLKLHTQEKARVKAKRAAVAAAAAGASDPRLAEQPGSNDPPSHAPYEQATPRSLNEGLDKAVMSKKPDPDRLQKEGSNALLPGPVPNDKK